MPVDPLSVACPVCEMEAGFACVFVPDGAPRYISHAQRIEAALIHAAAAPVAPGEHFADDDAIHNALKTDPLI